jgi:hypothetical protein
MSEPRYVLYQWVNKYSSFLQKADATKEHPLCMALSTHVYKEQICFFPFVMLKRQGQAYPLGLTNMVPRKGFLRVVYFPDFRPKAFLNTLFSLFPFGIRNRRS